MNGFSESDLLNYQYLIYSNIIQSIHQLIEGAKTLNILMEPDLEVIYLKNSIQSSHVHQLRSQFQTALRSP